MMAMVEGNNSAKSKEYNLKIVHPRSPPEKLVVGRKLRFYWDGNFLGANC